MACQHLRQPGAAVSHRHQQQLLISARVGLPAFVAVGLLLMTSCAGDDRTDADPVDSSNVSVALGAGAHDTVALETEAPPATETRPITPETPNSGLATFDSLYSRMVQVHALSSQAVTAQVDQCMQQAGLDYVPLDNGLTDQPERRHRQLWNYPAADQAGTSGYFDPTTLLAGSTDPEPVPDPAYELVLYGDVVGSWSIDPSTATYDGQPIGGDVRDGCLPAAKTLIIGGGEPRSSAQVIDSYYRLTFWLRQAVAAVVADPDFIELQARWSACTRARGYAYDTLDQPPAQAWTNPRPSEDERETASMDWACKNDVGIVQFGDDALDRYLEVQLDGAQLEVQAMLAALDGVEERASEVLAGT